MAFQQMSPLAELPSQYSELSTGERMQDEAMAGRMDYRNKKRKVRRHDQLQGVP